MSVDEFTKRIFQALDEDNQGFLVKEQLLRVIIRQGLTRS
jgi:hypothetical protein